MKTLISFRLRKHLDADLIALNLTDEELPELCRNGLRLMLGIRTTRHIEVREKPLVIPSVQQGIKITVPPAVIDNEKTTQSPSLRSSVFTPQHKPISTSTNNN